MEGDQTGQFFIRAMQHFLTFFGFLLFALGIQSPSENGNGT